MFEKFTFWWIKVSTLRNFVLLNWHWLDTRLQVKLNLKSALLRFLNSKLSLTVRDFWCGKWQTFSNLVFHANQVEIFCCLKKDFQLQMKGSIKFWKKFPFAKTSNNKSYFQVVDGTNDCNSWETMIMTFSLWCQKYFS